MERINFGENLIMTCATWCLIRCKISCNIETFQAVDRCNKVHYTRNFSNSLMPSSSHFHRGLLYFTNALLWALRSMFHAVSPKMFHAFLCTAANQCMNFCNDLWPASLPSVSISCNWFTGSKLPLYVANHDDDILHMQGSLHPSCQTVSAVDFPVLWYRQWNVLNVVCRRACTTTCHLKSQRRRDGEHLAFCEIFSSHESWIMNQSCFQWSNDSRSNEL